MNPLQDAFISYGRADSKQFAKKLYDRLTALDLTTWFDFEDIPLGVDYQKQIDDGIEKADNFLYVIAPHSVNSPYCGLEVELALKRNKRIIPLLHVEEISRETWQQRNPSGTDEAWAAYKEAGKHSSFPNMHPAIGKINWVYFREGLDDFEQSLQGLLDIFQRQKDYVHQHTVFLAQAMEWEQNQKQNRYLLVGEERQEAEEWLQVRFKDTQPPCLPTDLHCEFITESTEYADNSMTRVFLSHSEEDSVMREKVRRTLLREGITLWTNRTDIKTGTDFQREINQGIEKTDNMVYLLSKASLVSPYCQQELNYARQLNKRIIPLLIEAVEVEGIPTELRQMQFIDYTESDALEVYQDATSKLLQVLNTDAAYYNQHKKLLVKALQWEEQKRNPSILLRGYNLQQSKAWLTVAQKHDQHRPTELQAAFIAESLAQPPDQTIATFLCAAQSDLSFARKLNDTLQIQSKTTWFEPENTATDSAFQQARRRAMETAENMVFVLSPGALKNEGCLADLNYASQLSKRIIPVVYRGTVPEDLPAALAETDIADFRKNDGDFLSNFGELFRTLESDPDHVEGHTRLLVKGLEWDQRDREDGFLLRGQDLTGAGEWLAQTPGKLPVVTELHQDYIKASQELPFRKIKLRTVGLVSLAVTVGLFVVRAMGALQPLELAAYDHLLRSRSNEPKDDRFLMVMVDEASGGRLRGEYEAGLGTIPDPALDEALQVLETHGPRLIALDFYRDFETQPELADRFQNLDQLIAVCKAAFEGNGVAKPQEIPIERIGFNDFIDDGNRFFRRHLIKQAADPEFCDTEDAFSTLLARKYLEAEGVDYGDPWAEPDTILPMTVGTVRVPELYAGNSGGYEPDNDAQAGFQTLLNYRTYDGDPNQFAEEVTFEQILNDEVDPALIRDRIVMIGYTDKTDRNADSWNTPYGEMPGATIQAQLASQLLSAAIDGRPLIWWWSVGPETGWILIWSTVGGLVFWGLVRPSRVLAASAGSAVVLYGLCYITMVGFAGWIPLVPAALGWGATGGIVALLTARLRRPSR